MGGFGCCLVMRASSLWPLILWHIGQQLLVPINVFGIEGIINRIKGLSTVIAMIKVADPLDFASSILSKGII